MVSEIRWVQGYKYSETSRAAYYMVVDGPIAQVTRANGLWFTSVFRRTGVLASRHLASYYYWRLYDAKRMVERNFADLDPKFVHPRRVRCRGNWFDSDIGRRRLARRVRHKGGRRAVRLACLGETWDAEQRSGGPKKPGYVYLRFSE